MVGMAKRPARVYRKIERPYTRRSKRVHRLNYIKGVPGIKIQKFDIGNPNGDYDYEISMAPKKALQVRDGALEAIRVVTTSYMRKHGDPSRDYHIKIRVYPHHVLREHAQAAVAQADRFYDGMSHPFGNPCGTAAQVKAGQPIVTIRTTKRLRDVAREACRRAGMKIGVSFRIIEEEL